MTLLIAKRNGMSDEHIAELAALGFRLIVGDYDRCVYNGDPEEIDAVICFQFFKHNDISRFKNLKLIHLTSAGYDHMPLDYLRQNGIALYNARGLYSVAIAEFVLWGVLQLYKEAAFFTRLQKEGGWCQLSRLRELGGKNVAILGAGSIAAEISKRFAAMGCSVTALCRHPKPNPDFAAVRGVDELEAILPKTDILILAAPLNEGTYHIMNSSTIPLMKKGSILVNIARGGLVDTEALMAALEDETLSGAVLDVFEEEPLPADHPLRFMENVIVTPHNAFAGEYNPQRCFEMMHRDLKDWLESR